MVAVREWDIMSTCDIRRMRTSTATSVGGIWQCSAIHMRLDLGTAIRPEHTSKKTRVLFVFWSFFEKVVFAEHTSKKKPKTPKTKTPFFIEKTRNYFPTVFIEKSSKTPFLRKVEKKPKNSELLFISKYVPSLRDTAPVLETKTKLLLSLLLYKTKNHFCVTVYKLVSMHATFALFGICEGFDDSGRSWTWKKNHYSIGAHDDEWG